MRTGMGMLVCSENAWGEEMFRGSFMDSLLVVISTGSSGSACARKWFSIDSNSHSDLLQHGIVLIKQEIQLLERNPGKHGNITNSSVSTE